MDSPSSQSSMINRKKEKYTSRLFSLLHWLSCLRALKRLVHTGIFLYLKKKCEMCENIGLCDFFIFLIFFLGFCTIIVLNLQFNPNLNFAELWKKPLLAPSIWISTILPSLVNGRWRFLLHNSLHLCLLNWGVFLWLWFGLLQISLFKTKSEKAFGDNSLHKLTADIYTDETVPVFSPDILWSPPRPSS